MTKLTTNSILKNSDLYFVRFLIEELQYTNIKFNGNTV